MGSATCPIELARAFDNGILGSPLCVSDFVSSTRDDGRCVMLFENPSVLENMANIK